jgi:hypothetical protein
MTEAELKYWQNWKPRPMDVQFMAMMIETMKDGGVWAVPVNKTVYKVDKAKKAFVLIEGGIDHLFYMNQKALQPLGWTVEVSAEAVATGAGKTQAGSQAT